MTTLKTLALGLNRFLSRLFSDDPETIDYLNGADSLPPPLNKEEEKKAFELLETDPKEARELLIVHNLRLGKRGEKPLKKPEELLIVHNLRLVVYIAKKFESTGTGIEDLISIGSIGLIKAVNTFCPDKNIKLATYASRCIENEILMFLRKSNQYKNEISIDEPLNVDWDGNELLLSDILGTDDDTVNKGIESEVEKQLLLEEIEKLCPREKQIMKMRFGLSGKKEMTQKQVADEVGISQSYISRLEKRIIKSIRRNLEKIC